MTRNRPTLTERRAEELRLAIARTAVEIFVADGDTTATVERIAEAAGVATRTFYRHFPVKEDVVRPLFQESSTAVIGALRAAPVEGDLVETLVMAWTSTLHEGTLSPFDRRLMRLVATTPQYRLRWLEADDELCAATAEFLDKRVTPGGPPLHQTLPAYLLVQAVRHVFDTWIRSDSTEAIADLLREALRMVLTGVLATHPEFGADGG